MRDINQTIIKFEHEKNFENDDFFLSKSNEHVFKFLDCWPKWERNFINIIGEQLSGKTHLINIFLKKNKGIKFEANSLKDEHLKEIKVYENIVLENLTININEKLLYNNQNYISPFH